MRAEFTERTGSIVASDKVYVIQQEELNPLLARGFVSVAESLIVDPASMRRAPGCHLRPSGALQHGWTLADGQEPKSSSASAMTQKRWLEAFRPRIVGAVTVTTRGEAGRAVAVFTWRADSTDAIRTMVRSWIFPGGDGTARFRRFDDGLRIEAMQLRNAGWLDNPPLRIDP